MKIAKMSENQIKIRLVPRLALLLVLPALIGLGFWQLDRAEQKKILQAKYDARINDAPIAIGSDLKKPEDLQFHRVTISGYYDESYTVLLDNRVREGVPGYYVITPLRLNRSETRVLVNRGWIARGADRTKLPDVRPPTTLQRVIGVATVPHARIFRSAPAQPNGKEWQQVWQQMNIERFAGAVNYPVQPVIVLLDPQSPAGGFVREWKRLDTGIAVHRGLAFQWFLLAVILAAIYVFFPFWQPKKDDDTKNV